MFPTVRDGQLGGGWQMGGHERVLGLLRWTLLGWDGQDLGGESLGLGNACWDTTCLRFKLDFFPLVISLIYLVISLLSRPLDSIILL